MTRNALLARVGLAALLSAPLPALQGARADDTARGHAEHPAPPGHAPDAPDGDSVTDGSVTIGGMPVHYQAVAGTLIVHGRDWDDSDRIEHQRDRIEERADAGIGDQPGRDKADAAGDRTDGDKGGDDKDGAHRHQAEASMFYVAYFRHGVAPGRRPITFLFNGGPGSSTLWLHMGSFGPRRVVTADDQHTDAAPYGFIDNDQSLLDTTDLVFIDAPGTGFSRIAGPDREHAFYGIDQDAHAFTDFIAAFLSKYRRWNSPKYLFGESYGTTRAAVLSAELQNDRQIDLNGVILLSQFLNADTSVDGSQYNPGIDLPYVLALPTYAATALYHHKLPPGTPTQLPALLTEVEHFAETDYLEALEQGAALDPARRAAIAERLHAYTGLPVDYIRRSDLRINGGQFEKMLLADEDMTTGRLDTRFSGPSLDPLSREAGYDPQDAGIAAAYVAVFNDYVRNVLHYGDRLAYRPEADLGKDWDQRHQPPGADPGEGHQNVLVDLAAAMKTNPKLKVQLNAGYFDLATPFYEGIYEMRHLPIPDRLQRNIEYHQYASGHMVYVNVPALHQLHDNVEDFIRRTDNLDAAPGAAPAHAGAGQPSQDRPE